MTDSHKLLRAAIGCAFASASLATGAVPRYAVKDLGVVNAPETYGVSGLNARGQVVGNALVDGHLNCFIYDSGSATDIGTLGGQDCNIDGIDDAGTAVGTSSIGAGASDYHAFTYSNGVMTDLGAYPGDGFSAAVGINKRGDIVGNSVNALVARVFVWRKGHYKSIPAPASAVYISASAINARGAITGFAMLPTDAFHAFLYTDGQSIDLGTLGNGSGQEYSAGLAINASGAVVGWSSGAGFWRHAMIHTQAAGMVDLGTVPTSPFATSLATGINDRGWVVVGTSDPQTGDDTVAFLYDGTRTQALDGLLDASSAGWVLTYAQSINHDNQITGLGRSPEDGLLHVFLATPTH